ncbi:MAG: hypothetical protein JNL19_07035 [Burkholderiales bacterium]|nr:hypothetical protein [Burkholderiales bacterium]
MNNADSRFPAADVHDAWANARIAWRRTGPPDALEGSLLKQFAVARTDATSAAHPLRPRVGGWRTRWLFPQRLAFAVAGSMLLAAGTGIGWLATSTGRSADVAEVTTPFMLVAEPIGNTLDVSQLLRVSVSREAMLDFGIPVPPQKLHEPVRAELLLGARGEPLAVRFVDRPVTHQRAIFY